MRLTGCLQFYIRYRRVPGLLRYGKNRVIPPISIEAKKKVANLLVIQRDNMDLLNKPFLSETEEAAYKSVVVEEPYVPDKDRKYAEVMESLNQLRPHYTTEELMDHLKVNKNECSRIKEHFHRFEKLINMVYACLFSFNTEEAVYKSVVVKEPYVPDKDRKYAEVMESLNQRRPQF